MKFGFWRIIKYIAVCVIALVPLCFYVLWFWNSPISDDPGDWASFGSYIGGLYSIFATIIVVYLARELSRKDKVSSKRKEAVEAIHQQIVKIKSDRVDAKSVNKLFHLLDDNKLYLTDSIYDEVKNLADYFLEVKSGTRPVDFRKENSVKEHLRAIYNA